MTGYKVFTFDWRSPIQGGDPMPITTLPHRLPSVTLDTTSKECGAGWNFTRDLTTAVKIAGLWGHLVEVEASEDVIERGSKCRASGLTIVRYAPERVIRQTMRDLVSSLTHVEEYVEEQWQW